MTSKVTSDGGKSNTIMVTILKNPNMISKIVYLTFLEVILVQDSS